MLKRKEGLLEMKRKHTGIFLRVCWIILFTMTSIECFHIFLSHSPFPISLIIVLVGAWLFALAALLGLISLIFSLRRPDI